MGVGEGSGLARGKTERVAVPAMPMPMAILCCILNFLIPGLGTIVAGFSTFCCARNEDMSTSSRVGACCVSFSIGLLQLITLALLLLGWVWSCIWGIFFIGMSAEYYHDNPPTSGTVIHPQVTQPTIVVQPGIHYPQYPPGQPQQGQNYPQYLPGQPQQGQNYPHHQQGGYGQGPSHQNMYGNNPSNMQNTNNPYGEPPPAYEATPSAPPMEK